MPLLLSAAGALLLAAGVWTLVADVPVLNTCWYLPAWYGYLAVLSGLIHLRRGESLPLSRPRELGAMLFWSVPFWFIFEAYNLAIRNWYYVFTLRSDLAAGAVAFLAFATVLPACFFHAELLAAFGLFERMRWRPLRVGRGLEAALVAAGAACMIMPVVLPRYAFWMVWGAALGLPAVCNRRARAPSLLADLEAGRPGRLLRLAAGGMIAGGVWECANYWARCKWIYTVPGLEDWKLFEMPVAGFLGFPVLALAGFESYSLVCHLLRGGRHWEPAARAATGESGSPARSGAMRLAAAGIIAYALSVLIFMLLRAAPVGARRPLLAEIQWLEPRDRERLAAARVRTPERLVRALADRGAERLADEAGIPDERLEAAGRQATLAIHKGMGAAAARGLLAAGVQGVAELAGRDPAALHARLAASMQAEGLRPPRLEEVQVWVRAARPHGRPRR